ncbi:MAG: hypothetical protein CL926_13285 [Deltaproteobacteria bacterium]|nr:hypothetical protein [Deltaproteobacteria bacterium]|tara:strand:+ start:2344 stop:2568 length:225 start_codon:yes stop_codon:yes gene_type:complete
MTIELEALRTHRDFLLRQSDWTQFNDSPLSDDKKNEWKIYRQALRDITKTAKPKCVVDSPSLDPSSVTFPTKPS